MAVFTPDLETNEPDTGPSPAARALELGVILLHDMMYCLACRATNDRPWEGLPEISTGTLFRRRLKSNARV